MSGNGRDLPDSYDTAHRLGEARRRPWFVSSLELRWLDAAFAVVLVGFLALAALGQSWLAVLLAAVVVGVGFLRKIHRRERSEESHRLAHAFDLVKERAALRGEKARDGCGASDR